MAIKVQEGRSIWDRLSRRAFRSSNVPMVQDLKLLDYNSDYLSIFYSLQKKTDTPGSHTAVRIHGKVQTYYPPLDYRKVWLKKYLEMFKSIEKRPWFIINGDTDLLSRVKFTGEDFRHLQDKEVAFYFYEPLFQRRKDSQRCPAFSDRDTSVYFPELIWLEDFIHNHGGRIRAKVYVCDYGLKTFLKQRGLHTTLEVETWDIFLADLCRSLVEREIDRDKDFRKNGFPFERPITKKFICPNFRYEGVRELITGFLRGGSYGSEGHISFFHSHDRTHFLHDLAFDPQRLPQWERILKGIEGMQSVLPLILDSRNPKALLPHGFSIPDGDGISNSRTNFEFYQWYAESALAIVNETRFATLCGEISEKTFLPILYMRPFVIFGAPYMLRYLREMGFETFGDMWDESYDEIEDHALRVEALFNILDKILNKPLTELQEMLQLLKPRLARNREHLLDYLLPKMHEFIKNENMRQR